MATIGEKRAEEVKLQHELAIWEALYSYLDDNFISKDGREVKVLRAPGCPVIRSDGTSDESVQVDTLEQVLENIAEGPIKGLKDRIKKINQLEVKE